jgi:hypothetical protein
MDGYLILYRSFLTWEWYSTPVVKDVFLHCLFKANYKDQNWKGQIIKKGQFVTSLDHLSKELGLSVQQIRTSLMKLEKTQNITRTSTSRNTIITVVNWHKYHKLQQTNNKQITNNQQQLNKGNKENKRDSNKLLSLSIDEREILKKYLIRENKKLRKPIENIEGYISTLIRNGDHIAILEKEKTRQERIQQRKSQPVLVETFERVEPSEVESYRKLGEILKSRRVS